MIDRAALHGLELQKPWEYGAQPDLSLSWRQKLANMSKRVREGFAAHYHLPPEAREYFPASLDAMEITPGPQIQTESALKGTLVSMSGRVRDAIDDHAEVVLDRGQQALQAVVLGVLAAGFLEIADAHDSSLLKLATVVFTGLATRLITKPRLETLADYRLQKK